MRTIIAASLVFLSLIGTAEAGQITAQGNVLALTNVNQLKGIVGTAAFDEGPVNGNVPLNTYTPQGMTFKTGQFNAILPGVAEPGNAVDPGYWTNTQFPAPIAGGGVHVDQAMFLGGAVVFTGNITQFGMTCSPNGTQYIDVWSKPGVLLGQVTWTPSGDAAFVGIDTKGVPIGMLTFGNDDVFAGQAYDVGGSTNISDTWIWAKGGCVVAADCNDSNACTTDSCDVASGACSHAPNDLACNDGNACTKTDTCVNGACVGSNLPTCVAFDSCHEIGVCNPVTGMCSNPPKNDGTSCDDANPCTVNDACKAAVCQGGTPKCAPPDSCHTAGVCDPATGMCSVFPVKPNGAACSDNNGCTQTDTCSNGVCLGSAPVMCPPLDACHVAGICNAATGQCDAVPAPDGTACNDGDLCTEMDGCQAGVCVGTPLPCPASDACHEPATCNPMSGQCDSKPKAEGVSCDDGNPCTQTDTCQKGTCAGSNPITCMAKDECHVVGTCAPATGTCDDPAAPDGTACSNGTCQAGACTPNSTGAGGSGGAGEGGSTSTATSGVGGSSAETTGTGGDPVQVGGCGCGVASSREGGAAWFALALILAARRRRERR